MGGAAGQLVVGPGNCISEARMRTQSTHLCWLQGKAGAHAHYLSHAHRAPIRDADWPYANELPSEKYKRGRNPERS